MTASKINVVPLADRVVVSQLLDDDKKTVSGIIIPDTVNKEKPAQGTVIAVGNGRVTDDGKNIAMSVKKGDTILFSKYGPDEVKIDGEDYLIISESNILAIIK